MKGMLCLRLTLNISAPSALSAVSLLMRKPRSRSEARPSDEMVGAARRYITNDLACCTARRTARHSFPPPLGSEPSYSAYDR